MGRSELAAQQRMQLEAVLETFEEALRDSTDGNLPDVETYLSGIEGEPREYLEREMRTLVRDLVRGQYLVLNPIESGGMGSVSRVRHLRLGKVMALKEIRPEALQIGDRTEVLRRFQREIEACGRLDEHPNVVSYTDTGVNDSGVPFLVMDYIDGEDLGKIVRRLGPLSLPDAARAIHDAAVGLAHAHDHGLVHRDVKPSNIMISRHGTIKVLDFGLARITTGDHHLTALTSGKVMGTFDYMSPELCRETTPDLRGDIYSLGGTFYYVLAGQAPFEAAKSQFDKMDAHLHANPAPIARLDEHPGLWAVLQKMMAKKPEDRYHSLHEVADALLPHCAGSNLRALVRSPQARSMPVAGRREHDGEDTAVRATNAKAADKTAEWTRRRAPRGRRWWLTATLVAAGAAILASLLVAAQWRQAQHRQELAKALGTLPGLNGRWWFEEAPWLLPDVRQELVGSLADADEASRRQIYELLYDNANAPEAYYRLEELKKRFQRRWPYEVASHLADVEMFDPEDANPDDFAMSLRNTVNNLESKPPETRTGADLHLRAVVHHYLQELEPASQLYEAAVERYSQEGQPALRSLCLLDWGDLLHGFRQPARAHSKFRLAYQELANALPAGEPLPPLFELYAKTMEADSHRRIDHMPEAAELLDRAQEIAETLPENHPLRAFVLERRGWLDLDLWRLPEAQRDFEQALAIRRSGEPENHRAAHFILWDLQGVGMTQMYAGETLAARKAFHDLLDQIAAPKGTLTKKQLLELEDRRPNLYERLADTALYSGSDELDGMPIDPVEELSAAIQFAKSLKFAEDGRRAVLIRLEYKMAVVLAMRGERESAEVRRDEALGHRDAGAKSSSTESDAPASARPAVFDLTEKIAQATLEWKSDSGEDRAGGRKKLVGLLQTAGADLSRDDLLLLLYVGENLLKSKDLAADERTALAEQIRNLISAQAFPSTSAANSPFAPTVPGVFRRYLELARVAADEN